jgi:hypothetical protein
LSPIGPWPGITLVSPATHGITLSTAATTPSIEPPDSRSMIG